MPTYNYLKTIRCLILEASLADRWILATFADEKVSAAGLYFLLVQPDDSGMTYTGLWLLQ